MKNRRKIARVNPSVKVRGFWSVEAFDPATDKALWSERLKNAATTEGLTHLLSSTFAAGSQVAAWYMGLISSSGYTGVDDSDTMASHAGWAEATGYSSATRPQWTPLAVAAGIATNSSEVVLTATASLSVRGFFVTSVSTKGGTTGTLWSTALFSTARSLVAGNGLRLRYTVIATGGNS
jgi:hypothetical protein